MQGKLENASSWVGRPSPVLGLVAHYNHTSHSERMPVLGLAAPSPVLGLVARMLTVPTRRVVWAGLIAPKLTIPMKRAAAHRMWTEHLAQLSN